MPEHPDSSVRLRVHEEMRNGARIKVVGVGGGGNNAINRMIDAGMEGVEFISVNTDLQSLQTSKAQICLQLGARLTRGLGTGASPELGRRAALEDPDKILEALEGADMVFITAGLGGGTGTGAAPVIAALASQMGALTVAIVTRPFGFEGKRRMNQAERGLQELLDHVDTLIVIPNEKLLAAAKNAGFFESFKIADDILQQAVRGISDIITVSGVINRDFADVKATMAGMGYGVMGTASRTGPGRAAEAALAAITSPLLEAGAIDGARGILINITGSHLLRLSEVHEASTIIQRAAHEDANIIFGAVLDERLGDEVKITVIATGFHQDSRDRSQIRDRRLRKLEQSDMLFEDAPRQVMNAAIQPPVYSSNQAIQEEGGPAESDAAEEPSDEVNLQVPELREPDFKEIDLQQTPTADAEQAEFRDNTQILPHAEREPMDALSEDVLPIAYEDDLLAKIDGPPFDLSLALDEAPPLQADGPSAQSEMRRLRQVAMAAYSAISEIEDESEEPIFPEARSFSAILESRQKMLDVDQIEQEYRPNEEEMLQVPLTTAPPDQKSIVVLGMFEEEDTAESAIEDEDLRSTVLQGARELEPSWASELFNIRSLRSSPSVAREAASLSDSTLPPSSVTTETINGPAPDFKRRLALDPEFWPEWESSESGGDLHTRIPSFAVVNDPDESSTELDELDIPAFLRLRT